MIVGLGPKENANEEGNWLTQAYLKKMAVKMLSVFRQSYAAISVRIPALDSGNTLLLSVSQLIVMIVCI